MMFIGGWDVKTMGLGSKNIGDWALDSVTVPCSGCSKTTPLTRDLGDWNEAVQSVTDMEWMFKRARGCSAFNQDIGDWAVTMDVHDMHSMFANSQGHEPRGHVPVVGRPLVSRNAMSRMFWDR